MGGGGGGGRGGDWWRWRRGRQLWEKGRVGKDGKEAVTMKHPTNALTHQLYTNILIYYYLLYTDRVTSLLFGNEQRRGEVRLYYIPYTQTKFIASPLFGNKQQRDLVRLYYLLYTDIQTELPRRCSEMNNGEVRSVCIVHYIQTELPHRYSKVNNVNGDRGEVRL